MMNNLFEQLESITDSVNWDIANVIGIIRPN